MSRGRVAVIALAVALVVVGSPTAAWALWTATGTTGSSTTFGKPAGSLTGTADMGATFSSTVRSTTRPLTLTNTGNIAGTTATTVSVVSGSSTALAQAVDVVAWPVATTAACTATTPVGSGSVSGTWASLPSLSSALDSDAAAVWCVRSTVRDSAPASSTANIVIGMTVQRSGWTSAVVSGGFYLDTAAAGS